MLKTIALLSLFFTLSHAPVSLAAISAELNNRLESCEPGVAIAAAEEIINNPAALKEPLQLFAPALVFFRHGKKDESVFWYYAAQLRIRYQLASEENHGMALMSWVMSMIGLGAPINNYAFQDVSNFRNILDRVVAWDKKTANPYPESSRSKWSNVDKEIAQIYVSLRAGAAKEIPRATDTQEKRAWLATMEAKLQVEPVYPDLLELKEKLTAESETLESKARLATPDIEKASPKLFIQCRKPAQPVAPGDAPKAAHP